MVEEPQANCACRIRELHCGATVLVARLGRAAGMVVGYREGDAVVPQDQRQDPAHGERA